MTNDVGGKEKEKGKRKTKNYRGQKRVEKFNKLFTKRIYMTKRREREKAKKERKKCINVKKEVKFKL